MAKPKVSPGGKKASAVGGVGGAGGGTALIALADHLGGVATWPGFLLMYGAPAIAVLFGGLVGYLGLWVNWVREASVIWHAERTIEKELNDPHISEERKAVLRAKREEFKTGIIDARIERAKKLSAKEG